MAESCGFIMQICLISALSFFCRGRIGFVNSQVSPSSFFTKLSNCFIVRISLLHDFSINLESTGQEISDARITVSFTCSACNPSIQYYFGGQKPIMVESGQLYWHLFLEIRRNTEEIGMSFPKLNPTVPPNHKLLSQT